MLWCCRDISCYFAHLDSVDWLLVEGVGFVETFFSEHKKWRQQEEAFRELDLIYADQESYSAQVRALMWPSANAHKHESLQNVLCSTNSTHPITRKQPKTFQTNTIISNWRLMLCMRFRGALLREGFHIPRWHMEAKVLLDSLPSCFMNKIRKWKWPGLVVVYVFLTTKITEKILVHFLHTWLSFRFRWTMWNGLSASQWKSAQVSGSQPVWLWTRKRGLKQMTGRCNGQTCQNN